MKPKPKASSSSYDLIIIGGGPAGYTAAIKGALQGFKVAVIEKGKVGGACINRGCIPTKALWGTAKELRRLEGLKDHGIRLPKKVPFDFSKAVKRQFSIIDQMVATIEGRMLRLGVTILRSEAHIESYNPSQKDAFLVSTSDQRKLRSKFILVCTGSRPAESGVLVPDHKRVLTTDDIVLMKKLPKKLAIAGGGVVACEFASIFRSFGVKVYLFEHSSQVLSSMDPEVVQMLMSSFKRSGIQIYTHTTVKDIKRSKTGLNLTLTANHKIERLSVDALLLAIGRKANSENLGLEKLGVKFNERGHIKVNNRLETACKGLYAAGDVIGGQMLAHKAWYDASIAVRSMCGEEVHTDYHTVPGAIFTIPEMASVGLQPDQARQKGMRVAIGKFLYSENSHAMCIGETEGMVKAVIDGDSGKVVGCTLFGHDASNLISEVALAMQAGLSAKDIGDTIHPHPTLSEMIWESFLDTQGLSVHKL